MTKQTPQGPRIVLLTGDGKGKSSSAFGMALRAAGHGMRVAILQFVKGRKDVGEVLALSRFSEVTIEQCGLGFLPARDKVEEVARHRAAAEAGLKKASALVEDAGIQMVVLDEICGAVHRELVTEEAVLSVLDRAHNELIVVLTGRNATPGLIARADTVSRIDCIKHGMTAGWKAQNGVEC